MSNDHPAQKGSAEPPAATEPEHRRAVPDAGPGASAGPSGPLRMVLQLCALLCMLVGPAGCYKSLEVFIRTDDVPSAQLWLAVGVAASVGVPIVMAVVAAFRRDRMAAAGSAALLGWPLALVAFLLVVSVFG